MSGKEQWILHFVQNDRLLHSLCKGWGRLAATPPTYPIPKHKTLIVISNEVRNLSQDLIYKVYRTTMIHTIASPKLLRCSVRSNIMVVTFISLKQKLRKCNIIKSQDDFVYKHGRNNCKLLWITTNNHFIICLFRE